MPVRYKKDPQAVLDFGFDFKAKTHGRQGAVRDWLATGETITAHQVTADTGLTVDSSEEADGLVTAWVSGGEAGQSYKLYCQVTTSAGRTDERTMIIDVVER